MNNQNLTLVLSQAGSGTVFSLQRYQTESLNLLKQAVVENGQIPPETLDLEIARFALGKVFDFLESLNVVVPHQQAGLTPTPLESTSFAHGGD